MLLSIDPPAQSCNANDVKVLQEVLVGHLINYDSPNAAEAVVTGINYKTENL